ncbi:hypothetical protein [Allokutzneria sp. NRRL B-24872]|uniref:hypothetical protein n=1 Tax=Allokutzneria sp. NRRL B-24872 TaxID=1137961 RepID=UPI000A37BCDF|nr:hypothetical protein [Allokutzneria sp. NRRL B-24872]
MSYEAEAHAFLKAETGWDDGAVDTLQTLLRDEGMGDYYLAESGSSFGREREQVRRRLPELAHIGTVSGEDPARLWQEIRRASSAYKDAKDQGYATYKSGYGDPAEDERRVKEAAKELAEQWRRLAAASADPWCKLAAHHTATRFSRLSAG